MSRNTKETQELKKVMLYSRQGIMKIQRKFSKHTLQWKNSKCNILGLALSTKDRGLCMKDHMARKAVLDGQSNK